MKHSTHIEMVAQNTTRTCKIDMFKAFNLHRQYCLLTNIMVSILYSLESINLSNQENITKIKRIIDINIEILDIFPEENTD